MIQFNLHKRIKYKINEFNFDFIIVREEASVVNIIWSKETTKLTNSVTQCESIKLISII